MRWHMHEHSDEAREETIEPQTSSFDGLAEGDGSWQDVDEH